MATKTPSRVTSLLAALFAVALLATACGGDDGGDESTTETTVAADDGATTTTAVAAEGPLSETPAAELRAELAALLEEQVFLIGSTVQAASVVGGNLDAPLPEAYEAAATESAVELANGVGAVYGAAAGVEFNQAWDDWREAVLATSTGGSRQDVTAAREEVVGVLASLDPDADFSVVVEGIEAAEAALLDTVAALAAGDPGAGADLREAGEAMPPVALDLADLLVETRGIEGEVDDDAAELRADLTAQLQESVMLTGLLIEETVQTGNPAAPGPAGVRAALRENSDDIGATMEPDNPTAATALADLLNARIGLFVDYTVARLEGDATALDAAEGSLDVLRDDIGAVLAEDYPVSMAAVAEELVPHVESVLAFADAVVEEAQDAEVAESPSSPELLRDAAREGRLAARTLAALLTSPEPVE